jgi:hypothetical protein
MQFKNTTLFSILTFTICGGIFFTVINKVDAQSCTAWTPEYTAGCVSATAGKTIGETASSNCPAGTKGTSQCKFTADCTALGKSCCQWKCDPIVSGSDDCSGFCVPMNQCEPGSWPAPALSDPNAKGSCKSVPNAVCCGQQIVTPEGQAPGTPEADSAASAATKSKQADQPIGAGCKEPTTGLVVPCVAQGNASQVVIGIIKRVVNWLLTLSGTLFLIMFVWGGVQFIIYGSDSSKAAKGQKTLVNAIIGVAIVLFSYVILDYIFGAFIGAL